MNGDIPEEIKELLYRIHLCRAIGYEIDGLFEEIERIKGD
jgi:hypothetical protein